MSNQELIKAYECKNHCKLGDKKEHFEKLADFLINNGDIYFENYKPFLKLKTFYANISDKKLLCTVVRKHIAKEQRHLIKNRTILEVIGSIADHENLQINFEEARIKNKHLINFANGVYSIRHNKLLDSNISFKFDYQLNAKYIQHDKRRLDTYRRFIETSIGEENEQALLRTIGVAVSSIRDTKKMVLILGDGDSGKSKICDLIERAVGSEYVVTNALDKLGSEKAIASYEGKRVNLSRDTPIGAIKEDAGFKSVISCEAVNGRLLYHNEVSVTPKVFCVAASNEFVKISNADDATISRIVPIKIDGYKGIPDPNFGKMLLDETDAIVSKSVETLLDFLNNDYDFKLSKASQNIIEQEKRRLHVVQSFIDECCDVQVEGEKNRSVTSRELYEAYEGYCKDNALDPIGKIKFFDKIKQSNRNITYHRVPSTEGKSVNGFKGISLK